MKCPHCGQEHPDATKFCPETGKKMESQSWICLNPDCDFREPLPMSAKFCPNCGKSREIKSTSETDSDDTANRVIIAYERADEEDGYDDSYKYVTIFKDSQENTIYDGVVHHDTIWLSLKEIKTHLGNKNVIYLESGFDSYIEVSANGIRTDLRSHEISRGNYNGSIECNGFNVVNCKDSSKYQSLATRKLYDDICGNFLLNSFDKGEITYFDIFDRYTEEVIHSRIPVRFGGVANWIDRDELKNWMFFDNDDVTLLINRYVHFCLNENEVVVDNTMYDPRWQSGYRVWPYCSGNRILTTLRYDEYHPNYDGIKGIRMRDEKGNIVKEIDVDGIFLKNNFKFNRCLAIKTKRSKKVVVFIDENGDIHEIPNTKVHGEAEDIHCFFVTKDVLIVQDEDGAIMLNTRGEEIFECRRMSELDGDLVEFFDLKAGKSGVIDSAGRIIIPAEYETFDVIAE